MPNNSFISTFLKVKIVPSILLSLVLLGANYGYAADEEKKQESTPSNTEAATAPKPQEHDEAFSKIGQWIKRGDPLKEAPTCYQLWKCVVTNEDAGATKERLPEGTWGLCDDFLTVKKDNQVCNTCNAPIPKAICQ